MVDFIATSSITLYRFLGVGEHGKAHGIIALSTYHTCHTRLTHALSAPLAPAFLRLNDDKISLTLMHKPTSVYIFKTC